MNYVYRQMKSEFKDAFASDQLQFPVMKEKGERKKEIVP